MSNQIFQGGRYHNAGLEQVRLMLHQNYTLIATAVLNTQNVCSMETLLAFEAEIPDHNCVILHRQCCLYPVRAGVLQCRMGVCMCET